MRRTAEWQAKDQRKHHLVQTAAYLGGIGLLEIASACTSCIMPTTLDERTEEDQARRPIDRIGVTLGDKQIWKQR